MEIKKEIHELKQQVLGQQLNQMTAMTNAHHAQYPTYHVSLFRLIIIHSKKLG